MTRHSANSYKNGTCLCGVCCSAHTREQRAAKRARFAAREDIGGVLVAITVPEENHGRASTYRNWGCRCEECSAAESVKTVERRESRRSS